MFGTLVIFKLLEIIGVISITRVTMMLESSNIWFISFSAISEILVISGLLGLLACKGYYM